jgi:hypothetical protein
MRAIEQATRLAKCHAIEAGAVMLTLFLTLGALTSSGAAESGDDPKTIRKMCGSCPEGYATTGVTSAPEVCKDNDATLVQCVPVGANMLGVCGTCPEGYRDVGRSNVPARCGSKDGGLMSQCQLEKMGSNMPDPTQGGVMCPPHCGSTASPGQGAVPPPPKFRPSPDAK